MFQAGFLFVFFTFIHVPKFSNSLFDSVFSSNDNNIRMFGCDFVLFVNLISAT